MSATLNTILDPIEARHIKQLERMLQHRQKRIDEHDANSFVKSETAALHWALLKLYDLLEKQECCDIT